MARTDEAKGGRKLLKMKVYIVFEREHEYGPQDVVGVRLSRDAAELLMKQTTPTWSGSSFEIEEFDTGDDA